ncbi:MAG: cob(I)yrinic acid a,c-diamide adenosyltransferase [Clostridiales bacterium]|nr:cob(I)yrinic acid a,c-diamide adenosyltransferase [Clostridiales bacterium]
MLDRGYIQVYTGNGKGKTTAAFGLALRSVCAGHKVFIGQFMKGQSYCELMAQDLLPRLDIEQFGSPGFISGKPSLEDMANAAKGLCRMKDALSLGGYDVVVFDEINTALYFGLVTDTGRFQYTNTTAESHIIAAELFEAGADFTAAYREIYQNVKAEKLLVERAMLDTLELFADGKGVIAFVREETLLKYGAGEDETDGMSEKLRGIIGVEVSVFLKERPDGKVKASMRSKEWLDVAALAGEFGGGGHVRAAGFTSELPIEDVRAAVMKRLEERLSSKEFE